MFKSRWLRLQTINLTKKTLGFLIVKQTLEQILDMSRNFYLDMRRNFYIEAHYFIWSSAIKSVMLQSSKNQWGINKFLCN
jgi:hypothetical protein